MGVEVWPMAKQPTEHRMDERLAVLLEVEQKLEARVQQREAATREKLEAARAALLAAQEGKSLDLEEAAEAEARADEAAHAAALAVVTSEQQAALARFENVSDEVVEQLARRVLARAVGGSR